MAQSAGYEPARKHLIWFRNANDFVNSPVFSTTPGPSQDRSTPRVDRIVDNIWERNYPKKQPANDNAIEFVYLDISNSTDKQTPEIIHLESTPNNETEGGQNVENEIVEGNQLNNNETEEH